jgi:hypothetical protein
MTGHLPSGTVGSLIQALAIVAVSGMAAWRSWLAYRITVIRERERTTRMTQAISGARPAQRSEIIRACGALETLHRPAFEYRAQGKSVNQP